MWDRVIGCQERSVAFVAVAVVMRARMSLLPLSSGSEIQEALAKYISETVVVRDPSLFLFTSAFLFLFYFHLACPLSSWEHNLIFFLEDFIPNEFNCFWYIGRIENI